MKARLLKIDARLSTLTRLAENRAVFRRLAALFAHSGDSWFWLVGLGLLYWLGSEYWKFRAIVMVQGILLTAVIVMVIKLLVRRRRPAGEWGRIYRNTDPHSFPSGHAARAIMLAAISLGLGPGWLGGALLLWAPLVSLARVSLGVHYFSDIVAGLMVGLVTGLAVLQYHS